MRHPCLEWRDSLTGMAWGSTGNEALPAVTMGCGWIRRWVGQTRWPLADSNLTSLRGTPPSPHCTDYRARCCGATGIGAVVFTKPHTPSPQLLSLWRTIRRSFSSGDFLKSPPDRTSKGNGDAPKALQGAALMKFCIGLGRCLIASRFENLEFMYRPLSQQSRG